jgi:hypothetical protein
MVHAGCREGVRLRTELLQTPECCFKDNSCCNVACYWRLIRAELLEGSRFSLSAKRRIASRIM